MNDLAAKKVQEKAPERILIPLRAIVDLITFGTKEAFLQFSRGRNLYEVVARLENDTYCFKLLKQRVKLVKNRVDVTWPEVAFSFHLFDYPESGPMIWSEELLSRYESSLQAMNELIENEPSDKKMVLAIRPAE